MKYKKIYPDVGAFALGAMDEHKDLIIIALLQTCINVFQKAVKVMPPQRRPYILGLVAVKIPYSTNLSVNSLCCASPTLKFAV